MRLTRRQFLKLCASSAAGAAFTQVLHPQILEVLEAAAEGKPPVLWLQGQEDAGCSVSLLNTVHPNIAEVLLKIISLNYHLNVMAASGEQALDVLYETAEEAKGKFILIVEGSVPTKEKGHYCIVGERKGKEITMLQQVKDLGAKAGYVVAVGACAAFGGIPAASPNPTGAQSVSKVLKKAVVNVPGCPAHPDWIVGTLVHVLLYGVPKLDNYGRPTVFFGKNIHMNCPNYSYYNMEMYAKNHSDEGCLVKLGCRGPMTFSDCPQRQWNNGVNWCIGSKSPCIGCCNPDFPGERPLYAKLPDEQLPAREYAEALAIMKGGEV